MNHLKYIKTLVPDPGGGGLQLHLYGGMLPKDWKIDPSADLSWPKNRPILRLFAIEID